MEDLQILLDTDLPIGVNQEKIIKAVSNKKGIIYKFIIGIDGIWKTIQDYSEKNTCAFTPIDEGKYTIMVQGKEKDSKKPFDILTKEEFVVGNSLKLIDKVNISNTNLIVGDKLTVNVVGSGNEILYRFWISGKNGFEPIRDYSTDSNLVYVAVLEGTFEILIECKTVASKEKFDEFTTIKFDVAAKKKIEILDFTCYSEEFLVNSEMIFKVDTNLQNNRSLLYKFVKISEEGKTICVQDYSSRKLVSYKEKEPGKYKLLCLVRDILSSSEYDDRAILNYNVEPYEKVTIDKLYTDIKSPQLRGNIINVEAVANGGRELIYKFIVEGPISEDTGYTRSAKFGWEPKIEGEYEITVFVKDISSNDEYEAKSSIDYVIDKRSEKPIRIKEIKLSREKDLLVGQLINMKVMAEGGIALRYEFIVFKNNIEIERIEYGLCNWADFIPEENGEYDIEVRVKDKYSEKDYDSNTFIKLKVSSYKKAEIDYALLSNKEKIIVGDIVELEIITQNTKEVRLRYKTKINGREIEDTGYINNKKIQFKPKCSGKYSVEIYAKNIKCEEEYDTKKEVNFYVFDSTSVINTKLLYNKDKLKFNEEITFTVSSDGGRDVCYEFYIMENENWVRLQKYSRKNFYTFIPFSKGKYKVMVLAKSYYKKVSYEDYEKIEFEIN